MQQIKLKSFRKKKNLTIESIKLQIFEKNKDFLNKRYNTVDKTQKDIIFTHSKRYLQSISPKKFEQRQNKNVTDASLDESLRINMRRYSVKDKGGSSCIKRRIFFVKEINQLKLAIRRNTLSKIQEQEKMKKKRVEERHLKTLIPIANDPQICKSFSEKVKRVKTQSDVFVSEGIQFSIPKESYENSMLLKPLNVSIDLSGSLKRKKQNDQIKKLEHALLQENRSLKFSRMNSRCRQTQVSPWKTYTAETQQSFEQF